ncbi:Ig-like domain-containing protein [bacterium]|nr:Ig-like domain-containing protein [bacterium]
MKWTRYFFLSLILSSLVSCIGEDIIDDQVDAAIKINNPLVSLAVGETYQFKATYTNNIGKEESKEFIWISSDNSIVSLDNKGLATGIQTGEATLTVSTKENPNLTTATSTLQVTNETVVANESRKGTIVSTSSYVLKGDFTLDAIPNENIIKLSISNNYSASTALPGLYIYLTNNPNSINGAYEIGPVTVFNGAHFYNLNDQEVQLNQYSYVLYWCKPFSVKVGEGKIN